MLEDENHRRHLALLTAISQVTSDLPRAASLLADADDAAAVSRLQVAYGLTFEQAQGVLDQQLWLFTGTRRAELQDQLRTLRDALAVPWDPPLTVGATMRSPRRAAVVIEGNEHHAEGQKLDDTVSRIVEVVREQVAPSTSPPSVGERRRESRQSADPHLGRPGVLGALLLQRRGARGAVSRVRRSSPEAAL